MFKKQIYDETVNFKVFKTAFIVLIKYPTPVNKS